MRFIILGGGTAGWMAACLLAKRWPQFEITLIESPEIGIIGVGEGSTPQLRAFFQSLGIEEREWMPRCNATYKNGISFHGWSTRPGYERYFHPFQTELDHHTAPHFFFHTRAKRTGRDVWAHPDRFFISAKLAEQRLGPIPNDNFPFDIAYGYHFDAVLVGQFLRDHAVEQLGVRHISAKMSNVEVDVDGQVTALQLEGDKRVEGDFFLDCSGFKGAIAQQALGETFIPFENNLFNDRAVAMPSPNDEGEMPCETRATALSAGWAWRIPLTNRAGNGYVYSSKYLDADAAETELRAHLGMLESAIEARHLKMPVGRVRNSWVGNVLAVGLAQGFIEPLEATALHIVQATVEGFADAFEAGGFGPEHHTRFNDAINRRYDGIRDYIVCHYRVNGRRDNAYWRDNAVHQNLSDSLKAIITCWFTGGDLSQEIQRQDIARYYAPLSWHCLFAGYGSYPDQSQLTQAIAELPIADLDRIDKFINACATNFKPHGLLLKLV
ncbi:MAG: tryptophan halogenase family protein [Sphingorhabdus sp.]